MLIFLTLNLYFWFVAFLSHHEALRTLSWKPHTSTSTSTSTSERSAYFQSEGNCFSPSYCAIRHRKAFLSIISTPQFWIFTISKHVATWFLIWSNLLLLCLNTGFFFKKKRLKMSYIQGAPKPCKMLAQHLRNCSSLGSHSRCRKC